MYEEKDKKKDEAVYDENTENLPEKYKDFLPKLVTQIDYEYQLAYDNQKSWLAKKLLQLKLYNNQKRDESVAGDPLLFTIFQTLLAAFYEDRMGVTFEGWEEGDEETAENLTALGEYDYVLMKKEEVDYYWLWDTMFCGRGLVRMHEFDRDERVMCPVPELIDSFTFLRDPKAVSVNGGLKGKGAMRFGGREINIPKREISDENGFFNYEGLTLDNEIKSLLKDAEDARNEAQGRDSSKLATEDNLGDNAMVPALEWRTIHNGKKCIVTLANGRKRPIRYQEIGDADTEEWDIVDKPLYPTSQDWSGVSIPDLVEDKQRMRSVMINLGIQATKADLYPMYLFDEKRVKNKGDLFNFNFNKFVAIQGEGDVQNAVKPMNKAAPRMDFVNFILNTLDVSAQKATATPDMQQGQISEEKRTLGELNLVASKVDSRYSLTARVFGWSERAFWAKWYKLYKKHFKDGIDEKVIRISGSYGTRWRTLTRENIIAEVDPDIKVESRAVSETKAARERMLLNQYATLVLADPNANGKLYLMRKLAKLNGMDRDDVARVYPKTIDEMIAEKENLDLDMDKLRIVGVNDDDFTHMEVHSKAAETPAKAAHIQAHMDSMMIKRAQPELFAQGQVNEGEALSSQNASVQTTLPNTRPQTPSQSVPTSIPTR